MHKILRHVTVHRVLVVVIRVDEVRHGPRCPGDAVDVLAVATHELSLRAVQLNHTQPRGARTNLSSRICAMAPTAATSPWLRLAACVRHATQWRDRSHTHNDPVGHEYAPPGHVTLPAPTSSRSSIAALRAVPLATVLLSGLAATPAESSVSSANMAHRACPAIAATAGAAVGRGGDYLRINSLRRVERDC